LDAYNGTVQYLADGGGGGGDEGGAGGAVETETEDYYLRARPHLLLDAAGEIVALSNGLRPEKASEYVFTLVQPVGGGGAAIYK
jgi:hypothetical protein